MNGIPNEGMNVQQPTNVRPAVEPVPPQIPKPPIPVASSQRRSLPVSDALARFEDDFHPMDKNISAFRIVDALLKHPGSVVFEIMKGRCGPIMLLLFTIAIVCAGFYGVIMGSFAGGPQWWMVPGKVIVGTFLSALICLPSLYIFTSLSGGKQSFGETTALLLLVLALSGVLLIGYAPISWIFSQSTGAAAFMGGLHLLFWISATYFGLRVLKTSLSFLNTQSMIGLTFWSLIFVVVVFQMCTTLRPLVGEFKGYELQGKMFFLDHWTKSTGKGNGW